MNRENTWPTSVKMIVITTLLLGALWLFIALKPMLTALIMAALLAYLLNPITLMLTRRTRLSQPAAARLVFVSVLLLLVSLSAILGTVVVDQFHKLEAEFLEAITALELWISQPIELLGYYIYPKTVIENLEQAAGGALTSIPEESLNFLSDFTNNLLWVLLFFFSLFYLLQDGHKLIPWLIQMWPNSVSTRYQALVW